MASIMDSVNKMLNRTLTAYGKPLPPGARRHVKSNPNISKDLDPAMLQLQKDINDVVRRYRRNSTKPPFIMAQIIVMSAILSVHWRRCKLGADNTVCVPAVVGEIDRRFKYYHDMQLHRMCVVYSSAGGSFELSSCNEFSREDVKRTLVKQRRNNDKASFSAEGKADLYAEVNALYEASYALQLYDLPLWQRDGPGNASR
ncbi:hypothetical protein B0A48_02367 [Cryoendolithus antarcticus]|uniref:Uncharacterized protein n=1 Tax=Cryoendolithus antarcticus TaxID=1507870 RepID=A0A1V8TNE4_9PEZI|nr:hypothetical protein B0A48_02367 [Cryoendolithus antarcticus]